jgi:UDP-N-acetylglucosamine:LPS N-acetylglucosamine transferase
MLAIPVGKQFEQLLNARYLEAEGYGLCVEDLTAARLDSFLQRLPEFESRLATYKQDGNEQVLAKLDEVLAEAGRAGQPPD